MQLAHKRLYLLLLYYITLCIPEILLQNTLPLSDWYRLPGNSEKYIKVHSTAIGSDCFRQRR